MKDIQTREDIARLVNAFYAKIRKDDLLGGIFNSHIREDQWAAHLEKLTDFWETNLFGIPKFKGSPSQKHILVDKHLNYGITQQHFERWLNLWFETLNAMFSGELAERAKHAAQKMATGQYVVIWNNRPEGVSPY